MSYYNQGMRDENYTAFPSILSPYRERLEQAHEAGMLIVGAERERGFYQRGNPEIVLSGGAYVDSVVGFVMDVIHILLLVAGAYLLVTAIV